MHISIVPEIITETPFIVFLPTDSRSTTYSLGITLNSPKELYEIQFEIKTGFSLDNKKKILNFEP